MVKLDEQLEAARAKVAQLEAKQKAREQRERAQARAKKRKAEVRAAIVMMAMIRKDAEIDESVAKYLRGVAGMVTKKADVEALRDAGYLPDQAPTPAPVPAPAPELTEEEKIRAKARQAVAAAAGTQPQRPLGEDHIKVRNELEKRIGLLIARGRPIEKCWQLVSEWEVLIGKPWPDLDAQARANAGWAPHPLAR